MCVCVAQQVKGNSGNNSVLTWCNYKTKKRKQKNKSTAKTVTDRATSQLLATEWDQPEDGLLWTFSRYDLVYYYGLICNGLVPSSSLSILVFLTLFTDVCIFLLFCVSGRRRRGRDSFAARPVTRDGWASGILSCSRLSRPLQRTSREADRFHRVRQPQQFAKSKSQSCRHWRASCNSSGQTTCRANSQVYTSLFCFSLLNYLKIIPNDR